MPFPRLSALSYWTYLLGGSFFYASFFADAVPDSGWFAYPPLSGPKYAGMGMDFWLLGLALVEVGGIATGIEIVVSLLKLRTLGMSLKEMPIFAWSMLVTGVMIVFSFTTLWAATLLLELDRLVGTHFFNPEAGGSPLLWQHLFWFFGHPEVYIMFIPATGIVSTIVPAFAKRPIVAKSYVITATIAIGFVSFGLWVHHIFATGIPVLASGLFTATSLTIALASGVQIFAWIATLWNSRPKLDSPLLFIFGFLFIFVLGGLTGVMVALIPFNLAVHDTFFVVAHFHYVLIGGVIFPAFAGIAYWFPKISGRRLNELSCKLSFWLIFVGFNLAFFPMHMAGLKGMPRRVYTYDESLGIDTYNLLSTIGAFVLGAGFILFLINALVSLSKGKKIEGDPWGHGGLEWTVPTPTPVYTFREPPIVNLEAMTNQQATRLKNIQSSIRDRARLFRATIVSDAVEGLPQGLHHLPGPTSIPFFTSLAMTSVFLAGLLKNQTLAIYGLLATLVLLGNWFWPDVSEERTKEAKEIKETSGLSVHLFGTKAVRWWGALLFNAV